MLAELKRVWLYVGCTPFYMKVQSALSELESSLEERKNVWDVGGLSGGPGRDAFTRVAIIFALILKLEN